MNSLFSRESVLRAYGLDSDVCYLGIDSDLSETVNFSAKTTLLGWEVLSQQKTSGLQSNR